MAHGVGTCISTSQFRHYDQRRGYMGPSAFAITPTPLLMLPTLLRWRSGNETRLREKEGGKSVEGGRGEREREHQGGVATNKCGNVPRNFGGIFG